MYVYLSCSVQNRQNEIKQDNDASGHISSYIPSKLKSLIIPFIVCVISIGFMFYQRYRINNYIQTNSNKMYWNIVQEHDLDSLSNLRKDTLFALAHNSFEKMEDNADERRKFRNYLFAYYQSDNAKKRHYIDIDYK